MPLQFKVKCNAALLFIFTVLQLGHNGTTKVFKDSFLNLELLLFDFSNNHKNLSDLKGFFDVFIQIHDAPSYTIP